MFNKDAECFFLLVFLENSNDYEWGAPFFAQPKPKTNVACFLGEFMKFK